MAGFIAIILVKSPRLWPRRSDMLCSQYLGAKPDDPAIVEAVVYLSRSLPSAKNPDVLYWFFATQALHNVPGPAWDTWNRQIRRALVEVQSPPDVCADGSWAFEKSVDSWSSDGGRLVTTSLCVLTLEVYYRYLGIFKLDRPEASPAENK